MSLQPILMPSQCPRCGLVNESALEQIERCAFCRKRSECLMDGRPAPSTPTNEYPAGRNLGDTGIRASR